VHRLAPEDLTDALSLLPHAPGVLLHSTERHCRMTVAIHCGDDRAAWEVRGHVEGTERFLLAGVLSCPRAVDKGSRPQA